MTQFKLFFCLTLYWLALPVHVFLNAHSLKSSEPITLSQIGTNAASPQIVLDPNGDAIVIWQQFDGQQLVIQGTKVARSTHKPQNITRLSSIQGDACNPKLAIDAFGNVTAVWESWQEGKSTIEAAYMLLGESWKSDAVALSSPNTHATHPQISTSSCGDVYVVWQSKREEVSVIEIAFKPFSRKWQTPITISSPDSFSEHPDIALDGYDTVGVVWEKALDSRRVIESRFQNFQEEWGKIDTLSQSADTHHSPKIVADASGHFTVVWNQFDGQKGSIQAMSKSYGGLWPKTPTPLSFDGNACSPDISINDKGDIAVAWKSLHKGREALIYACAKKNEEEWSESSEQLIDSCDYQISPQVAFDSSSSFIIFWNGEKGFSTIFLVKKELDGGPLSQHFYLFSPGRTSFSPAIASNQHHPLGIAWVVQDSLSHIETVFIH